jgi:hypothetical protein
MGSGRLLNVQLAIMDNLFPNHYLCDPIAMRTIRTTCVCQLSIKIQE